MTQITDQFKNLYLYTTVSLYVILRVNDLIRALIVRHMNSKVKLKIYHKIIKKIAQIKIKNILTHEYRTHLFNEELRSSELCFKSRWIPHHQRPENEAC